MAAQQLTKNTGSAWGESNEPKAVPDIAYRRRRTLDELPDAPEQKGHTFGTVKLKDSFEDEYDEGDDDETEEDF